MLLYDYNNRTYNSCAKTLESLKCFVFTKTVIGSCNPSRHKCIEAMQRIHPPAFDINRITERNRFYGIIEKCKTI